MRFKRKQKKMKRRENVFYFNFAFIISNKDRIFMVLTLPLAISSHASCSLPYSCTEDSPTGMFRADL